LREAVLDHQACLGQMPRAERRVLALRAGVGLRHTRSRAEVAHLTGMSRARVAATERRGMQRLRTLVRAGGCTSTAGGHGAGAIGAGGGATSLRPTGDSMPKIGVLGERTASADATPPTPPSNGSSDAGRPLLHAPDSAVDLAPALLLLVLGAFVFAAVREARRTS
jgi:hypothetical protein